MARIATPWFRSERNSWYVCKDGQQHFLGEHPEGAARPRKHKGKWNAPQPIIQAFHELMAKPSGAIKEKPKATGDLSVAEVFEKFLDWCQKHRAARTYQDLRDFIQQFLDESPGVADLAATALRPFQVIEWVDKHPSWGDTTRRNAIVAIQRPYNWADELGCIPLSPIRRIKKPQARRRETEALCSWRVPVACRLPSSTGTLEEQHDRPHGSD